MRSYLAVLMLITMVVMASLVIGAMWIVLGPWRLIKKIGRTGRHTRVTGGVISS